MRYRALSPDGDYQFGRSGLFLTNSPEAVAQAINTRLLLWAGEWFLDTKEGTPYREGILGYGTQGTRDVAIRERLLSTPGVNSLLSYASSVDPASRKMTVSARVDTIYGAVPINTQV